jgi:hypothetical protein
MYKKTATEALVLAMKVLDTKYRCDPEELIRRARDAGIKLPIRVEHVSAASLGGTGWGYRVPPEKLAELRDAIDRVVPRGSRTKKAA